MNAAGLTSLIWVPHSINVSNTAHWNGWWAWLTSLLFACWLPLSMQGHYMKDLERVFHNCEHGEGQNWDWIAESYSSRGSSDWCTSLQSRVWQFWQVLSLFCIDWIFTHNTMLVLHYCTGCMFQLWANIFPEEYITSNNIICIKSLKAVYTNAVTYFCFKAETIKMPYFIWL